MTTAAVVQAALVLAVSAALSSALIVVLRPLLVRYALARPNARSSHSAPTPQGGGIAVIAAVCLVALAAELAFAAGPHAAWLPVVLPVLVLLAVTGAFDDIRPLPVLPRLLLQFAAATLLVVQLPDGQRVLAFLPVLIERAVLVVGLVWFINLTNFMDGIDLMTVSEVVPVALTLAGLGLSGLVPPLGAAVPIALALAGALAGFAPFNRHVACLFLGDVGSLPIGALLGYLLLLLAAAGELAAALILPLYYLADATVTLVRRWLRGERLSQAHRSHFYQYAVQRGFPVPAVTNRVLGLNVVLAGLAVASVIVGDPWVSACALAAAMLATAAVLATFEKGR